MTINEIKKRMLNYEDFYGADIVWRDEIKEAKTKAELKGILNRHYEYLEDQNNDALGDLDNFKKELGLEFIED